MSDMTWPELQYRLTHCDECDCAYDAQVVGCGCECHAHCTECGEMIFVRYWQSKQLGWVHVGTRVACCGDPDEGDYRQATPRPEDSG